MADMRKRIKRWAWQPVEIPRTVFVVKYALFAYLGLISMIAGVPAFNLTAPAGYYVIWGAMLLVSGLISTYGATSLRHENIEKWGVLVVAALFFFYVASVSWLAYGSGDLDRQVVAAGLSIALAVPVGRFLYLVKRTLPKTGPVVIPAQDKE